jgi:hypothetical protein
VSRHRDCQPHGGREPGSRSTVNPGEVLLNAVSDDRPKRLTGLGQKGRGTGCGIPNLPHAEDAPSAEKHDLTFSWYIGGTW